MYEFERGLMVALRLIQGECVDGRPERPVEHRPEFHDGRHAIMNLEIIFHPTLGFYISVKQIVTSIHEIQETSHGLGIPVGLDREAIATFGEFFYSIDN